MRTIQPTGNQVLVRRTNAPVIPSDLEWKSVEGEVLAIGPGQCCGFYPNPDYVPIETLRDHSTDYLSDFQKAEISKRPPLLVAHAPMPCKVGDVVLLKRAHGCGVDLGDDLWLFVDYDVLAIVTEGK